MTKNPESLEEALKREQREAELDRQMSRVVLYGGLAFIFGLAIAVYSL